MKQRRHTKLIHEGNYAAEIDVELISDDNGWSPYLAVEDTKKLDEIRQGIRRRDLKRASQLARLFELTPVEI